MFFLFIHAIIPVISNVEYYMYVYVYTCVCHVAYFQIGMVISTIWVTCGDKKKLALNNNIMLFCTRSWLEPNGRCSELLYVSSATIHM